MFHLCLRDLRPARLLLWGRLSVSVDSVKKNNKIRVKSSSNVSCVDMKSGAQTGTIGRVQLFGWTWCSILLGGFQKWFDSLFLQFCAVFPVVLRLVFFSIVWCVVYSSDGCE